ncbi:MAG: hypothetical protein IPP78_00905 [Holophagaceae bacterium]|nr:hypothetical protein [Holophagaceae bacterium]
MRNSSGCAYGSISASVGRKQALRCWRVRPERFGAGSHTVLAAVLVLFALGSGLRADSVRGSKHDLSSNGNTDSTAVCLFCHTPHHANNTLIGVNAPLWNRYIDTTKTFIVYASPSMNTTPGNPNFTFSVLCLGCHDGTLGTAMAYGVSGSDKHGLINRPGLNQGSASAQCTKCHSLHGVGLPKTLKFGTDLSNMHPISMAYPTGVEDPMFHQPPNAQKGWPDLKLYNRQVECPTCHAVHDPAIPPFLRKSNSGSALCLSCHIK